MSENKAEEHKNEAMVKDKKSSALATDNLVNGIVLEFSVQKQVSEEDIAELNLPIKMHSKKAEATNNLIPISKLLNNAEEEPSSINVDLLVLETQVRTITRFVTQALVLEIEMNKLIKGVFSKNPELKPYLLRMKKLLQEHSDITKALDSARADDKKAS